MEDLTTSYRILGISPEASLLEVNQAYGNLLNTIRIDRGSGDPERQRRAQDLAETVNEAYASIKKVLVMYRELQASFGEQEPLTRAREETPRLLPSGRPASARTGEDGAPSGRTAAVSPPDDYALAAKTAAVDKAAAVIAAAVTAAANRRAAARVAEEKAEAARVAAVRAAAERALAEKAAADKADAIIRNLARFAVCLLIMAGAAAAALFVTKVVLPARAARLKADREAAAGARPLGGKQAARAKPALLKPVQESVPDAVKEPPVNTAPATDAAQVAEQAARQEVVARQAGEHAVHQAAMVRLAAERGDPDAENRLGIFYATGAGVPQDYGEAAKWYRKAAEQGHAVAQKNLAELLAGGKGSTKDLREAVKWFRRSASQGNRDAQRALEIWAER